MSSDTIAGNKVSPLQRCTLINGSIRGIISQQPNSFVYEINREYNDLQTYDIAKDKQDKRDKSICSSRIRKVGKDVIEVANPYCILSGGVGQIRKPTASGDAKCITYDCPPEWKKDGSYCTKPLKDYRIDRRSKCDERWYDWFIIPNYHLGNKYQTDNDGQCRLPCAPKHVPFYNTDPVDGSKTSLMGSADKLDRCVTKDNYFNGKYAESSDFCPLAWIHRMNSTQENIHGKLTNMYTAFGLEEGNSNVLVNDNFRALSSEEQKAKDAADIQRKAFSFFEDIKEPSNDVQQACMTLNTTDRLLEAYSVCNSVGSNTYEVSVGNPNVVIPVLKQACNAVFCTEKNNALDMISKDPICFPPEPIKPEDLEDPVAPNADKERTFMQDSVTTAVSIVIFAIMAVLFWFVWHDIVYPYIVRYLWWAIRALLFRFGGRGVGGKPFSESVLEAGLKKAQEIEASLAAAAMKGPKKGGGRRRIKG